MFVVCYNHHHESGFMQGKLIMLLSYTKRFGVLTPNENRAAFSYIRYNILKNVFSCGNILESLTAYV